VPEIRPALSYIGKMRRLEASYLAEIKRARLGLRRSLLDAVTREGVKLSLLPIVRREVGHLESQVTTIGRQQSAKVDEVALWYLNQQLGNLRRINEPHLPNIQQLNLATYAERQQIYQSTLQASPAWIASLESALELNITRLAVNGADVTAAIDRLLALNIADGRASAFRLSGAAAQTQTGTATWIASALAASALFKAVKVITRTEYEKQAIAVIDANTTDCCLRVHGQTQPLDKPFILEGTPRFADKLDSPPFHWNCRTATSLYTVRMEEKGVTTAEMTDAAMAEMEARERTGTREEIWPAHSTSRRSKR